MNNEIAILLAYLNDKQNLSNKDISLALKALVPANEKVALSEATLTRAVRKPVFKFSNNLKLASLMIQFLQNKGLLSPDLDISDYVKLLSADKQVSESAQIKLHKKYNKFNDKLYNFINRKSYSSKDYYYFIDLIGGDKFNCFRQLVDSEGKKTIRIDALSFFLKDGHVMFTSGDLRTNSRSMDGYIKFNEHNKQLYLFAGNDNSWFFYNLLLVRKGTLIGIQTFSTDQIFGSRKIIVSIEGTPYEIASGFFVDKKIPNLIELECKADL